MTTARPPGIRGTIVRWACSIAIALGGMLPAQAQDSAGGYRFAPSPHEVGSTRWRTDEAADYGDMSGGMISPQGHRYQFREDPRLQEDEQPMFRPDGRMRQHPRNWGADESWADDPVLRQGFIFRPLDSGRTRDGGRDARVPPPAPVPPAIPTYPYGTAPATGYPGYTAPPPPGMSGYRWPVM